jgi:lysozyme
MEKAKMSIDIRSNIIMNNTKNMLEIAITLIKEFEGCYLKAYPDPRTGAKPITIGYGSTVTLEGKEWYLGDKITQEEAENLLNIQLSKKYLPTLQKNIPVWKDLNANQQAALLSFAYNLGQNFYEGKNFNTITRVLKNKEFENVPKALLLYVNTGSNVEAGLRRRRAAEGRLFSKAVVKVNQESEIDNSLSNSLDDVTIGKVD